MKKNQNCNAELLNQRFIMTKERKRKEKKRLLCTMAGTLSEIVQKSNSKCWIPFRIDIVTLTFEFVRFFDCAA